MNIQTILDKASKYLPVLYKKLHRREVSNQSAEMRERIAYNVTDNGIKHHVHCSAYHKPISKMIAAEKTTSQK